MVRLKFRRHGKKKQPTYRLVAADSRSPRDGRFIEILGHYNPRTEPPTVVLKDEKIVTWLKNGAQPTESVRQVLETVGILKRAHEHAPRPAATKPAKEAKEAAPPQEAESTPAPEAKAPSDEGDAAPAEPATAVVGD